MKPFTTYLNYSKLKLRKDRELPPMNSGLFTSWSSDKPELSEYCGNWLDDIGTVAVTLGYEIFDDKQISQCKWDSGTLNEVQYIDKRTQIIETLYTVRCYYNGSVHIKFAPKFIAKFNCEFGRLKGWLGSPSEAAQELNISIEDAEESFNQVLRVANNPSVLCLNDSKTGQGNL